MIDQTDPRHGSPAGYTQGCREVCCSRAKKAEVLRRERLIATGHEFMIPRDRITRKLQALFALGHSLTTIGEAAGVSRQAVREIQRWPARMMRASAAVKYDEAYRVLEMKIPPDDIWTRRTKNRARAAGWLPPLAWEDIDAGILADEYRPERPFLDRFDEDLIDYVLQYHDFSQRLNPTEKAEVIRRWMADGRSERSLCALTGWRPGRYRKEAA